jgi:hypothetical protein
MIADVVLTITTVSGNTINANLYQFFNKLFIPLTAHSINALHLEHFCSSSSSEIFEPQLKQTP